MTLVTGSPQYPVMNILFTLQSFGTLFWVLSILGGALPVFFPSLGLAHTSKYGKSLVDPRTGATITYSSSEHHGHTSPLHRRLYTLLEKYTVPKRWFTHYYILATVLNVFFLYFTYSRGYPLWSTVLLSFYSVHCLRRLYECYFVHAWSDSRMSLPLYILGMLHYIFAPVSLLPTCRSETAVISVVEIILAQFSALSNIVKILGILRTSSVLLVSLVFFVVANYVQHKCHKALAQLRSKRRDVGQSPSEAVADQGATSRAIANTTDVSRRAHFCDDSELVGGVVPVAGGENNDLSIKGKLRYSFPKNCRYFRYTLSPHYTAELVIYTALVSAHSIASNVFGVPDHFPACSGIGMSIVSFNPYILIAWVIVNLSITALRTKQWYTERYPNDSLIGSTAAIIPALL